MGNDALLVAMDMLVAIGVPAVPIHRSAWNRYSRKFNVASGRRLWASQLYTSVVNAPPAWFAAFLATSVAMNCYALLRLATVQIAKISHIGARCYASGGPCAKYVSP
jgi:hypothetical protein